MEVFPLTVIACGLCFLLVPVLVWLGSARTWPEFKDRPIVVAHLAPLRISGLDGLMCLATSPALLVLVMGASWGMVGGSKKCIPQRILDLILTSDLFMNVFVVFYSRTRSQSRAALRVDSRLQPCCTQSRRMKMA